LWFLGWWAGWLAGAVVAAFGVDGEVAEDLAGRGVDDPHVHVGDEQDDAGSGVASADGDVVELAADAQGDGAADGDAVVTDSEVGVVVAVCGAGFRAQRVGDSGRAGESPWVWWRLGLLDSNQAVVGLWRSVEGCFELGWRDVAAVAVEAGGVVPVDPAERG
jgi:hypothetical protein